MNTQPTLDQQKRFWDWHWQHWQDRKTINDWKQKRHDAVLNFVSSLRLPDPHILDVGCGPGWYTDKLSHFGQVTGIDLSEQAIAMAKERFPHISFVAGNIYTRPLPVGHFDLVVTQEVIDHVEDAPKFVAKVASLLKPGGYLVLSCTNRFVVDRLDQVEFPSQPSHHIGRYFDRAGVKRLLSSHFRLLRLETIIPIGHRGILRFVNSHKLNRLAATVTSPNLVEQLKERAGFGYQIIILAQKSQ